MNLIKPRIMTPTESYVVQYPQFVKLADTQLEDCMWSSNEINVEKDKQDMLVNMTDSERHAVTTGLKLFTRYEMFAGKEYWLNRFIKAFPRPETERMASVFGMFELAVHAPFYNKLNQVLGLDTDEFYTSYIDDPVLSSRVDFLNSLVDDEDDLVSIGVFSVVEGAILFSLFSMFKSFQSNGRNMIGSTAGGLDQSAIDEGLHQTGGAMAFRVALDEMKEINPREDYLEYETKLFSRISQAAEKLYEHESRIADMLFEKGNIQGISAEQIKLFVKSRIDICLSDLGVPSLYNVQEGDNTIAKWFYRNVQQYQLIDFFTSQGREYSRGWIENNFKWKAGDDK